MYVIVNTKNRNAATCRNLENGTENLEAEKFQEMVFNTTSVHFPSIILKELDKGSARPCICMSINYACQSTMLTTVKLEHNCAYTFYSCMVFIEPRTTVTYDSSYSNRAGECALTFN
jgi:hypothetical protein